MSYTGPDFVNGGAPAINAANLNGMVSELERLSPIGNETLDIRNGADGTVYSSAGEAVRNQINIINDELNVLNDSYVSLIQYLDETKYTQYKYWNSHGVQKDTTEDMYYAHDPIVLQAGKYYIKKAPTGDLFVDSFSWVGINGTLSHLDNYITSSTNTNIVFEVSTSFTLYITAKHKTTSAFQLSDYWITNTNNFPAEYVVGVYANMVDKLSIINRNVIVVASDGSGDFTEIQDAISHCNDTINNRFIIFIKSGTYSEFTMKDRAHYISLIGESRNDVKVVGNVGIYEEPTAEIRTNGVVKNISFIQETSSETQGSAQTQYNYCYAVHDDYSDTNTRYENCYFYSNCGPAMGMGIRANQHKSFVDCEFVSTSDGTYGASSLGGFFAHTASAANADNQSMEFENCTAIGKNSSKGFYISQLQDLGTGCYFSMRRCGSYNRNGAFANVEVPLSYSFGNNVDSLNA